MASRRCGLSVLAVATLVVVGCTGGYLKRGTALYEEGRYIEAADVFEKTEYLLEDAAARERAEYAAYRGLTLLALGDLDHAHRWMAYAYQVEQTHPGALRDDPREALDVGWEDLGERMQQEPPPPSTPGTALAATQPPRLETPPPASAAPDDPPP